MAKFKKKPVVIEAAPWHRVGDAPDVYMHQGVPTNLCKHCGTSMVYHGEIPTLEGKHIVCPGDMVITGIKGERYPCKPDIFAATYEPVID